MSGGLRSWRLEWRGKGDAAPAGLIDGSILRPDRLGSLEQGALERLSIPIGAHPLPLAEIFRVSPLGETPGGRLEIEGSLRFVRLGARMNGGELEVSGPAGDRAAEGMLAGAFRARGGAGDYAGAGLRGGLLSIDGDAGDQLGGPPLAPGGSLAPEETAEPLRTDRGMTGGEILVLGNAGAEAGLRMRRGLIAIAGTAGPFPAHEAIAGTILIGKGLPEGPGVGMRRASVVLLESVRSRNGWPGAGFAPAGDGNPTWLRVLLRHLESRAPSFPLPPGALDALYHVWSGDLLENGRGEILARKG